jgi:penicillin-binding protein 2
MFNKRKRMEFAKPGERRRREEREQADNRVSRRVFLSRGAMGVGFLALGGKLWKMQIAEGNEFRQTAKDNTNQSERLKAPRGRILDRAGRPVAENRRAWSVQIVQSRLPLDDAERERVLQEVASTLQLKQVLVLDRALVPIGSEAAVVNAISTQMENVDSATLLAKITHKDAVMVLLKDKLEPQDADALAQQMSGIPGVRALNLLDYQIATHPLEDMPLVVRQDVDPETALKLASNSIYLPGVVVDDQTLVRSYPAGPNFSHIIGYVGPITEDVYEAETTPSGGHIYDQDDQVGKGGIEQSLETDLRGEKGLRWVQIDAEGVVRGELLDLHKDPVGGLSARLTVLGDFQNAVAKALQDGITAANIAAKKDENDEVGAGVAIVLNPQNGEILAMVSLPTFDNQDFVNGISQEKWDAYTTDKFEPLLDRAISGQYPPGSTFKPLVASIGLQSGKIKPDTTFKCVGGITVPWTWDETKGNYYPCWEYDIGHGDVDIYAGISQSCDVYFYNVGAPKQQADNGVNVHYYIAGDPNAHDFDGIGIDMLSSFVSDAFGFGKATGIELAGEADGVVPTPRWLYQTLQQNWSIGDTINVSIGQGHLLCTPLQLVNGTAAIVNGGKLYRPRLLKELLKEDGTVVKTFEPDLIKDLTKDVGDESPWIAHEHFEVVREGMRRTVTEGTVMGVVQVPNVEIGAKSGTAEYGEAVNGKYSQGHAWVTAFGPFENPEVVVVAMIAGGGAGSQAAGPVVNAILNEYFGNQAIRDAAKS